MQVSIYVYTYTYTNTNTFTYTYTYLYTYAITCVCINTHGSKTAKQARRPKSNLGVERTPFLVRKLLFREPEPGKKGIRAWVLEPKPYPTPSPGRLRLTKPESGLSIPEVSLQNIPINIPKYPYKISLQYILINMGGSQQTRRPCAAEATVEASAAAAAAAAWQILREVRGWGFGLITQ